MGKGPLYRSKDQVYSKYGKMNKDVAYFNDTYLSLIKSKPSGWNETKILQRVNKTFANEQHKPFPYPTVWEILRNNEKWKADVGLDEDEDEHDDPSLPSKRSRTSGSNFSDAHVGFNLNEDFAPSPPQEPQQPRSRARPMGRDKAKAQARDKGKTKEANPELLARIEGMNEKLERLLQNEAEKRDNVT